MINRQTDKTVAIALHGMMVKTWELATASAQGIILNTLTTDAELLMYNEI